MGSFRPETQGNKGQKNIRLSVSDLAAGLVSTSGIIGNVQIGEVHEFMAKHTLSYCERKADNSLIKIVSNKSLDFILACFKLLFVVPETKH